MNYFPRLESLKHKKKLKELQKLGRIQRLWRVWVKALGEKAGATNEEADRIAIIRTVIVACYIITNIFIVAGVIRHW
jgi:hypothetical protein